MDKFIVVVGVGNDIIIEASFNFIVGVIGVTSGFDSCPCSDSFPHIGQAVGWGHIS